MGWFVFQDCSPQFPGKYYYVNARTFKVASKRMSEFQTKMRLTARVIEPVNDKQPMEFLMSAQHKFGMHASVVFSED